MAEARIRYDEQVRWGAFEQASDDWHAGNRHREFLAAVRSALDGFQGQEGVDIVAQLDFAERRLDRLDPTRDLSLLVPPVPERKADDLTPFLHGWSPYGPDSSPT